MQGDQPLISIVIPVYNVEEYLSRCLESVINQTYTNLEIIVVDDGSTDKSRAVIKEFVERDNRIIAFFQKNKGANVARNIGLDCARGEWVYFMDGDDWLDDNAFSELYSYLDNNLDLLFFSHRFVYSTYSKNALISKENLSIEKEEFKELQYATLNRLGRYKFNVYTMDAVSIWNKIYRVDFLRGNKLRFIDELPKLQDLLFNLNVYEYAECGYVVSKAYYNYRINGDSVSNRYQEDIVNKFQIIHRHLNVFMEKHMNDEVMKQAYYERIATHLRTCVVLNFCNKYNPKGYNERKKEFLDTCTIKIFEEAMLNVNLNNFTFKERVLSICIRYHCFWGCVILSKLNNIKMLLDEKMKKGNI